jgi:LysM repeat protein
MSTYTVRRGDTLSELALRYHTTVDTLAKDNQIKNVDLILVGQKLHIDHFESQPSRPSASVPSRPQSPSRPQAPGPSPVTPSPSPAASASTPDGALPVGMPNTSGMSQAKEYALYSQYVQKHGDAQAKADLAAGRRVIVGLRDNTAFTADRPYRGTYDDRLVVLWKENGQPRVQELSANTEPNRRWALDPAQANKPVGRLVGDKTYHFKKDYKSSLGGNILTPDLRYGNPTERRDTNRDRRIDSRDDVFSGDWGGQYIYFHRGGYGDTYSAGCQTMDPGRFGSFWNALGGQSTFSYVLANVA